ncbi:MAG: hypothetical protein JSV58_06940 [Candidatus Bathyarchaeota archaeon]|nr:MAG: hypothetical protein JSV58_06940 [Candidatus Bathyarchaeota archaeon]
MKVTQSLRLVAAVSAFLIVASSVLMSSVKASEAEDLAILAIDNAKSSVETAFVAVSAAEAAGAYVTLLVDRLNVSVEYLALANMYLRTNDFYRAAQYADFCVDALAGVSEDAEALGSSAKTESNARSSMMAMLSIASAAGVACASLLCWRFFKKQYYKHILTKEVEVSPNES